MTGSRRQNYKSSYLNDSPEKGKKNGEKIGVWPISLWLIVEILGRRLKLVYNIMSNSPSTPSPSRKEGCDSVFLRWTNYARFPWDVVTRDPLFSRRLRPRFSATHALSAMECVCRWTRSPGAASPRRYPSVVDRLLQAAYRFPHARLRYLDTLQLRDTLSVVLIAQRTASTAVDLGRSRFR